MKVVSGIGQVPLAPTNHILIYYAVFNAFTIIRVSKYIVIVGIITKWMLIILFMLAYGTTRDKTF
jgi:hypothetical protein